MLKLDKHPSFSGRKGPVVLCILDGVGYGMNQDADAVSLANTPNLDWLHENCLNTPLKAHGLAVGLPSDDDMGNSEVGHNAIGCGRVFAQGAKLVDQAIESGKMFEGTIWNEQIDNVLVNDSTLHFLGLFSDGNVHSHIDHLKAMIDKAADSGVKTVRVHVLLDGRDVGETSALEYVEPFESYLDEHCSNGHDYRIASGGGRMFLTMDRYGADWSMVQRGWNVHVHGNGRMFGSTKEAVETYRTEIACIDQDMPEFVIADDKGPIGAIQDGDSIIFFNFRGDRGIEISRSFDSGAEFDDIDRGTCPDVKYAGMMEYDGDLHIPKRYLVKPPAIDRTMGEFLVASGVRMFAASETQKYGHVTYFFNGNRSGKFSDQLETYVEVPSDVIPFEQRPWMKGAEITDVVLEAIESGDYDFVRLNYPNGDMVGHTGNMQATRIGVESVDLCLARLIAAVRKADGILIVSADHGNADEMYELDKRTKAIKFVDGKAKSKTSHTLNPVPCIIFDPTFDGEYSLTSDGGLGVSSLAATSLNFLGYSEPEDYDPAVVTFN